MEKDKRKFSLHYDKFLLFSLAIILAVYYLRAVPPAIGENILAFFASIAALPVFFSALRSFKNKKVSIDLLASVALVVSLLNKQWASAVFINLMLTSARLFANYTENKSRNAIRSLLKLRPEKVKVKKGEEVVEETVSKCVRIPKEQDRPPGSVEQAVGDACEATEGKVARAPRSSALAEIISSFYRTTVSKIDAAVEPQPPCRTPITSPADMAGTAIPSREFSSSSPVWNWLRVMVPRS